MTYTYTIEPRPPELGGGVRLRLLEDGEEMGGGVFPVAVDPLAGIAWWNGASEAERSEWLHEAGSAVPAEAYAAYLIAQAHADADNEGQEWIASR